MPEPRDQRHEDRYRRTLEGRPDGAGIQTLGPSVCYNAGSLGPPRGRAQVGVVQLDPVDGACRVRHHTLDGSPPRTLEARIER